MRRNRISREEAQAEDYQTVTRVDGQTPKDGSGQEDGAEVGLVDKEVQNVCVGVGKQKELRSAPDLYRKVSRLVEEDRYCPRQMPEGGLARERVFVHDHGDSLEVRRENWQAVYWLLA